MQLQHLRSETKEISRIYVANLQRDIVQLIDFLNDNQSEAPKNSRVVNTVLAKMKTMLDEISLKPEKGRRKDLKRIQEAVRSMRKIAFDQKKPG